MARLGVNVDHVATLRQQRKEGFPDPLEAALLAEKGGADNITCHLREDRRHIQDADVRKLRAGIRTELNLEMAATEEMIRTAIEIRPAVVTLVPEKRQELTTEGGLDLVGHGEAIARAVGRLKEAGLTVSLFVDPDSRTIEAARKAGAQAVEIHTGRYANARGEAERELARIAEAAKCAGELGLAVHAGHGLDYGNISPVAALGTIESFQIGFSIVSRALVVGLERAVAEMKASVSSSRGDRSSR